MTKREAYKKYKKKRNAYRISSYALMLLTLIFFIIYAAVTRETSNDSSLQVNQILTEHFIGILTGLGILAISLICVCIFISNKFRTTVWMANAILGTFLLGKWALIITFGLWLLDEYILKAKAEKYKGRLETVKVMLEVND